jgi:ATP-binding cassette, subfamily A (ABC1), member 3
MPTPGGVRKRWNYFLKISYWKGYEGVKQTQKAPSKAEAEERLIEMEDEKEHESSINSSEEDSEMTSEDFEQVQDNLKRQGKNKILKIRNLRKVYGDGKVAVDNLNIEMYKNQIFVLLGHNGAGKTTTISMLTGLLNPTKGKASAFGIDMFTNMEALRRSTGLCPQHDILFDQLTVEEHIEVLGTFKGLSSSEIRESTNTLLKEFGLRDKRYTEAAQLSGGQKRRLSIIIAFLGKPDLVLLDEPSSGMDTQGRRELWNVLREYKKNRIIILTTHYMEEADYLGDRIAIMSFGKLRCCGSSLFLKKRFGIGYNLNIIKKEGKRSDQIHQFVFRYLNQAEIEAEVENEIVFKLPYSAAK